MKGNKKHSAINLLSSKLFDSPFFDFKHLKIHRSSNVNESDLTNFLIEKTKKGYNLK